MLTRQAPPTDFKWQADNIRDLRTHLGLSQTALSREIGIRQQTISEWETGMYAPRGASVTILTLLAVSSNFQFEPYATDGESTDPGAPLSPKEDKSAPSLSQGLAPRRLADSGPVSARQQAPAQRLTFEAAKAAQTDRRTGTYNSTYFESRPVAAARSHEVPM
jgi:transcriptional regulator with XRE-family HTH domain